MPVSFLSYSSTLKLEATCFSEKPVDFQWTTRRCHPALLNSLGMAQVENTVSSFACVSIASKTCTPSRCHATDDFSWLHSSGFQVTCYTAPSLRLLVPGSRPAYRHFFSRSVGTEVPEVAGAPTAPALNLLLQSVQTLVFWGMIEHPTVCFTTSGPMVSLRVSLSVLLRPRSS
jgi:hypothetical protein